MNEQQNPEEVWEQLFYLRGLQLSEAARLVAAKYRADGMREAARICQGLARKNKIQKSDRRARMADLCAASILQAIEQTK